MKYGSRPTVKDYECNPEFKSHYEFCNIANVKSGTYYMMVKANIELKKEIIYASYDNTPVENTKDLKNHEVRLVSVASNVQSRFTFNVPASARELFFATITGTEDIDLYIKYNSPPGLQDYDCSSTLSDSLEYCAIADIQAGTYHVMLQGKTVDSSGISLLANYETILLSDNVLDNHIPERQLWFGEKLEKQFTLEVPKHATDLSFELSGGSGNAELYVKHNAPASSQSFNCRSVLPGNNEKCLFTKETPGSDNFTTPGIYHVMLKGASSAVINTKLTASFNEAVLLPVADTLFSNLYSIKDKETYFVEIPASTNKLSVL